MFQFPGFALNPYGFRVQSPHGPRSAKPDNRLTSRYGVEGGFPHSEILGSKLVRSSPRLIAAYHVLHRLSAPRHPPNALKTLDRSHDRCPPLGSAGQRCQKDHFHPQPTQDARGRPDGSETVLAEHVRSTLKAAGAASRLGTCSLFTMSNIRRPRTRRRIPVYADTQGPSPAPVVEPDGIEPTTS